MIFRPQLKDIRIIGFYLGNIIVGLGLWFLLPAIVAFLFREYNPLLDFSIGFVLSFVFGVALIILCRMPKKDLSLGWMHGMVVVALSWVAAMFLGAVPMWLSGHWGSFLDACFDSMSGFATTGLALAQNIDHMPYSLNLWRHLTMFIGGQGIVIIALSFLSADGSYSLYLGEAREERILPNVLQTARFIWFVSFVYLLLGTITLAFAMRFSGMPWVDSIFQGLCIFMAAFATGGFTPHSQNLAYYHSWIVEAVAMVIMFLGAMSFSLHYAVWSGKKKEMFKDVEMRALFISMMSLFVLALVGFISSNIYANGVSLFRRGFFQLFSAHTGTGYSTIHSSQFGLGWHPVSILAVIAAMGIGGCIGSTTGAIKVMRLSLLFKSFRSEIKRLMFSDSTVVVEKMHHIKSATINDAQIKSALMVIFAFIMLYIVGAIAGVIYGYPLMPSLFESVSASANVGLSMGITTPSMPSGLKIIYILQMWVGRLEFISVFVLVGFLISWLKGK